MKLTFAILALLACGACGKPAAKDVPRVSFYGIRSASGDQIRVALICDRHGQCNDLYVGREETHPTTWEYLKPRIDSGELTIRILYDQVGHKDAK